MGHLIGCYVFLRTVITGAMVKPSEHDFFSASGPRNATHAKRSGQRS